MTPFQQHCERWKSGCGSCHCEGATKVVIARGQIPADVLLVGEAPGVSEDVRGIPFDGPAGLLLDQIVARGLENVRVAFTNMVGCLPRNETGKVEPDRDQIRSCQPRLKELIEIVKPRLVVAVGGLAEKHLPTTFGKSSRVEFQAGGVVTGHATIRRWCSIVHPAYILRAVPAQRSLLVQRSVVTLANAVGELP
jgi:uracil-DNA glycosylase